MIWLEEKLKYIKGCTYFLLGLINSLEVRQLVPYIGIILIFGTAIIFTYTCYQVLLQKEIEDKMKGKIFAILTSIGDATIPIGVLVYGVLLDYIKLYWAATILGILIIPFVFWFYKKYQHAEVV